MKPILSLALLFFFISPLFAQDEVRQVNNKWENVEEEIWSLEEDYISYFKEANHQAILSLGHDQMLVWPESETQPMGKERGKKYLEENYPEPIQVIFQIKREGIRVIGNVVITHYLLISAWVDEDGIEQKSESRITHTWIKEVSEWKIFGGMSNSK
ncbi:MAG: nuclear transport factor 2 family protein [Clostridiaceae bacterium]|nr:nuclear transport factor 2 family protein [Clostridiaceae bacterium]